MEKTMIDESYCLDLEISDKAMYGGEGLKSEQKEKKVRAMVIFVGGSIIRATSIFGNVHC